jgi:hypothetical protein
MRIQELVDLEDLKYRFLVSNTSDYLYKSFYTSSSVLSLMECKMDYLIEAINTTYDDLDNLEQYLILLVLLFAIGRKDLDIASPYFKLCINQNVLHCMQIYRRFKNNHIQNHVQITKFELNTTFNHNFSNNQILNKFESKVTIINK